MQPGFKVRSHEYKSSSGKNSLHLKMIILRKLSTTSRRDTWTVSDHNMPTLWSWICLRKYINVFAFPNSFLNWDGFLHLHWGCHMAASVPVKEPWRVRVINIHCTTILKSNDITTIQQNAYQTHVPIPWPYLMGYTLHHDLTLWDVLYTMYILGYTVAIFYGIYSIIWPYFMGYTLYHDYILWDILYTITIFYGIYSIPDHILWDILGTLTIFYGIYSIPWLYFMG